MRDRRSHSSGDDEKLEGLLRGLPRREPSPALRGRVLSRAARRRGRLSPAWALAGLLFLIVADVLVVRHQEHALWPAAGGPPMAVAAQTQPQTEEGLEDLLMVTGAWPLHSLRPQPEATAGASSYLSLRRDLLREIQEG